MLYNVRHTIRKYMALRCALISDDDVNARFELFNTIYMNKMLTEHVLLQGIHIVIEFKCLSMHFNEFH